MRFVFLIFFSASAFFLPYSFAQEDKAPEINNYLDIAATFKEKMDYGRAIIALEALIGQSSNKKPRYLLGKLYYLNGNSQKALEILTNLKEKDWLVFLYLGLIYEDLGKQSCAVTNYLYSLKLKKNIIALYRLGKTFYHAKNYKKSAIFFSDTLALDSSIRLANYYLGDCFLKMGNYEKAYSYASKGINFYPNNDNVKKQLSEAKQNLGEYFFAQIKQMAEKTRTMVKLMFYAQEKNAPLINVGIANDLQKFTFRSGGPFTIKDSKKSFRAVKDKYYTLILKDKRLFLIDYDKKTVYAKLKSPIKIKGQGYPFYILDVLYGKGNFWHKKIDRIYRGDLKVVLNNTILLINILSVEEYLYGVLPAEISSRASKQALKAQAVAARTIAFKSIGQRHKAEGFDVCADIHCQVYQGMSVETAQTNQAVDETKGEVLLYNSQPFEALYHANCGGCLRRDVFGEKDCYVNKFDSKKEYTKLSSYEEELWFSAEPESFCLNPDRSNYRWQRVYDAEDFFLVFGFPLRDLKAIVPLAKGDCPYYQAIDVRKATGALTIGGNLRIRDYLDKLRSSSFKVEIKFSPQRKAQLLFFWGAGFGHGAGLCQDGARAMAEQGYTYIEILKHYYPKANIKQVY
ncbi:MAG: SpoIID/LytB domain-containing protein [Candidatus Omnitrophota bacterium]|nr:SpoIID/LytB domain-containing protein [Candidatus Omnitrophota bacterium]